MPDEETRKAELLAHVQASRGRLEEVLARLSPEQMEAAVLEGNWSPKVVLGHIAWWEQLALHALTGEPDEDILPGEEWNLDRANAVLFARNRSRPLDDVLAAFHASHAALVRELEATPAARLDGPSRYGGSLHDLIAGNTYQHYDEHTTALAAAFGFDEPTSTR